VNSHTHTGSELVASRLRILTRWGSARALNSRAVASAWSSDSEGAASGVQQAVPHDDLPNRAHGVRQLLLADPGDQLLAGPLAWHRLSSHPRRGKVE
jgi:hypothetical protein